MQAPGMKITNFHYSHMTFDKAPGTLYPKWVHMSGYESVIAQDAEVEAELLARPAKSGDVTVQLEGAKAEAIAQPVMDAPAPILEGVNTERDLLIKAAQDNDIKIDKRWTTDKIRKAIEGTI